MQKTNEDCFYFITSTCAKGPLCLYRHNPAALTSNTICSAWLRGNCIDSNCNLRHSNVQRPTINNGITCFYENTPMGCLKPDCTYMHLRPRFNVRNSSISRPSTTNLVNKPSSSPTIESIPEIPREPTPPPTPVQMKPKEPTPPPPVQIKPIEPTPPPPSPVQVKPKEPIPPPSVKSVETVPSTNQSKSPNRNVINNTSDETKTPSRAVGNRSVVVAEPNRKVVQTTSNRVVVSSQKTKRLTNDSDSDLEDFIEHESDTKKTKTVIDVITFPCSLPRLFVPSKPTTPTNDTKPIRLNRNRLPAATNSTSNTTVTPSKEEQKSAGTGLLSKNEEERRINRLERFKKKPTSPPRSVVNTTTRNVIDSSPNERKRPATDSISNNSPPAKRLSSQQENNNNNNNHHQQNSKTIGDLCSPDSSPRRSSARRRRRSSSISSSASSSCSSRSPSPPPVIKRSTLRSAVTPTTNELAWNRQVDEFLAKTSQPKPTYVHRPPPLLSVRPRFTPTSVPQQSVAPRPRPRQPTSLPNNNNRPSAPVTAVPSRPIERSVTPPPPPASAPPPAPVQVPTVTKDDDENRLLDADEPSDVVDTFALIDEALLETDLLELM